MNLLGIAALALAAVGVLAGIVGILLATSASRRRAGYRCGVIAVISGVPLLAVLLAEAPCFSVFLGLAAILCGTFAILTARESRQH
jgi:uncharacterized membrane protein HdeD (DUF308 family)